MCHSATPACDWWRRVESNHVSRDNRFTAGRRAVRHTSPKWCARQVSNLPYLAPRASVSANVDYARKPFSGPYRSRTCPFLVLSEAPLPAWANGPYKLGGSGGIRTPNGFTRGCFRGSATHLCPRFHKTSGRQGSDAFCISTGERSYPRRRSITQAQLR